MVTDNGFVDQFTEISKINYKKNFSAVRDTINYSNEISKPGFLSSNLCRLRSNQIPQESQNSTERHEDKIGSQFILKKNYPNHITNNQQSSMAGMFYQESIMSSTDINRFRTQSENYDYPDLDNYKDEYFVSNSDMTKNMLLAERDSQVVPSHIESFNARKANYLPDDYLDNKIGEVSQKNFRKSSRQTNLNINSKVDGEINYYKLNEISAQNLCSNNSKTFLNNLKGYKNNPKMM